MIIPIPWHSADIRLKNSTSVWSLVDKCPSFTRMVTEYHGFCFLFVDSIDFSVFSGLYLFRDTPRLFVWKNSDICVKACQLANSHGLLLSITDFFFIFVNLMAFLNYPKITFVPWYSAIIRVKKLGHPCEDPSDTPCHLPFAVSTQPPWTCAAFCKAYTSKHDMGLISLIFDRSNSLYFESW